MKNRVLFVCVVVLLFAAFSVSADAAAPVRVSAAASLIDAVRDVAAAYRDERPETDPVLNFASSGALAKQISAGAAADIYISANPKWMAFLEQQGTIAAASKRVLVGNSLVFVGLTKAQVAMADLPALDKIALGSPKATPVGRYAEQSMTAAGVYQALATERKLVFTKDVRQALFYADRGEVDGAFVYRTDALLAAGSRVLFVVPQDLYPRVIYPAALTRSGQKNERAVAFFNYLFGRKAREIFARYGFIVDPS